MLAANDARLRTAGILIPNTCRVVKGSAGHHNAAWELAGNPQFDSARGTFEQLLRELRTSGAPAVCLSSEEFEFLHAHPAALRRLHDGLRGAGYEPRVILYLRPQSDYLESLYAEVVKAWDIAFVDFLETILATGRYCYSHVSNGATTVYGYSQFAYDKLVDAFAGPFGRDKVYVRAYRSSAPSETLLRDFVGIIGEGAIDLRQLKKPRRLNPSFGFAGVIGARNKLLSSKEHRIARTDARFHPLGLRDIARIYIQFAETNERIYQTYGVRIGYVTWGRLLREIVAVIAPGRKRRERKHLIRELRAERSY